MSLPSFRLFTAFATLFVLTAICQLTHHNSVFSKYDKLVLHKIRKKSFYSAEYQLVVAERLSLKTKCNERDLMTSIMYSEQLIKLTEKREMSLLNAIEFQ